MEFEKIETALYVEKWRLISAPLPRGLWIAAIEMTTDAERNEHHFITVWFTNRNADVKRWAEANGFTSDHNPGTYHADDQNRKWSNQLSRAHSHWHKKLDNPATIDDFKKIKSVLTDSLKGQLKDVYGKTV